MMRLSLEVATLVLLFLSSFAQAQAQCPDSSQGVDPAVFETCIPAPTSTVPVQCPASTQGINPEVFSACVLAPGQTSRVVPMSSATSAQSSSGQSTSSTTGSSSQATAAATAGAGGIRTTTSAQVPSSTRPSAASSSTGSAAGAGVNSASTNNGSNHHYRNTVVIPAVVASVVGALLIAAIILCCLLLRRRRRKRRAAAGVRIESPPSEDEKQFAGNPEPTPMYDTHRQQPPPTTYNPPPFGTGSVMPVQEMSAEPTGRTGISSGLPLVATAVPFMKANTHEDSYRPAFVPPPATSDVASSPTRSSIDSPTAKPWAAQPLRHFRRKSLRDSNAPGEVVPGPGPTAGMESITRSEGTFPGTAFPSRDDAYDAYRPSSAAATPPPTGPLPPIPTSQQQVSQQPMQAPREYYEPGQQHEGYPESGTSQNHLAVPGTAMYQPDEPTISTRPGYTRGLSAVDEASVEDDASFYSNGRRADGGASGLTSLAGSRRSRNQDFGGYDSGGPYSVSPDHSTSEQLPSTPALGSWLQSRGIDLSLNNR